MSSNSNSNYQLPLRRNTHLTIPAGAPRNPSNFHGCSRLRCPDCRPCRYFQVEEDRDMHYFQQHILKAPRDLPPPYKKLEYEDAGNYNGPLGKGMHVLELEKFLSKDIEEIKEGKEFRKKETRAEDEGELNTANSKD
ncbi:hypothetical protein G7Y89_g11135 [Cudoniella acicularis]|uniref:Uncharacterized protein n=1 Tax=Cudoniella acicularis TaxID=354080 RepID=A0A8H4RBF5_9HELO|nr:hypothetical protein G7Y89_g11135 [Cudoniella acicularis]